LSAQKKQKKNKAIIINETAHYNAMLCDHQLKANFFVERVQEILIELNKK
jgi:hypothetical protein